MIAHSEEIKIKYIVYSILLRNITFIKMFLIKKSKYESIETIKFMNNEINKIVQRDSDIDKELMDIIIKERKRKNS